ncbi:hypothetical protein M5X00_27125 [Paenibacillus alvei]|uniref:Uncharacterized protein n=1 Tax=Paenibacillus alvei TaxID=44250 RepID=A0AAP6ZSS4_PAEAL|nr:MULTISPECIES: hypothetical protein [Paenibacillus]EJW17457.1 hypothetical protein PAV_4c05680 [Paenibacillus alvei DSM 29]MCY7487069.1 hypothetical protein [Paenibacillus alvei]MCY9541474.1 hypothetical protein [Paenibacillus alvei]MCY9705577.1 hypothetical protein [Paenibacillus alvei]MCY9734813.1 hypothetical protein [Paenibacillus alvei]
MDPIIATVIAVVIMVIGMVLLLLYVTKKAYARKWDAYDPMDDAQKQSNHSTTSSDS